MLSKTGEQAAVVTQVGMPSSVPRWTGLRKEDGHVFRMRGEGRHFCLILLGFAQARLWGLKCRVVATKILDGQFRRGGGGFAEG